MDNIKNKNKSISNNQDEPNQNSNFNFNIFNLPKSLKGYQCIGPCYPPNTLFYHPMYLRALETDKNSLCPVTKFYNADEEEYDIFDNCKEEDITLNYEKFELFEDVFQFASNDKLFLSQIYNINNLNGATEYLEESIELLPVYSQKRILNSIYNVWNNNKNFPVELFCKRVKLILKSIYKIDISTEKIKNKIIDSKKYNNIFSYFEKKYNKKK